MAYLSIQERSPPPASSKTLELVRRVDQVANGGWYKDISHGVVANAALAK